MKNLFAFLFGGLFSVGLMLSSMSNPEKVLDFLDLTRGSAFGRQESADRICTSGKIRLLLEFRKEGHRV